MTNKNTQTSNSQNRRRWAGLVGLATLVLAAVQVYFQIRDDAGYLRVKAILDIPLTMDLNVWGYPIGLGWEGDKPFGPSQRISSPRVTLLQFRNVGRKPLDWHDVFGGYANFKLRGNGKILEVDRDDPYTGSPRIGTTVEYGPRRRSFSLDAEFLNPGEEFRLRIMHTGGPTAVRLGTRLRGKSTGIEWPTSGSRASRRTAVHSVINVVSPTLAIVLIVTVVIWSLTVVSERVILAAAHALMFGAIPIWTGWLVKAGLAVGLPVSDLGLAVLAGIYACICLGLLGLCMVYIYPHHEAVGVALASGPRLVRRMHQGTGEQVIFGVVANNDAKAQRNLLEQLLVSDRWMIELSRTGSKRES